MGEPISTIEVKRFELLLTVARILRAHIASPSVTAYQADDLEALDEALAPWAPKNAEPVNLSGYVGEVGGPWINDQGQKVRADGMAWDDRQQKWVRHTPAANVAGYTHAEDGARL